MLFFRNCLGVTLLAAAGLLGAAQTAVADTYALYNLSGANSNVDRAVYADGTVMVYGQTCGANFNGPCYKTYDHGSLTSLSPVEPPTAWDNGSACTVSFAGQQFSGSCNGNYEAFVFDQSNPLAQWRTPGLYAGALDDLGLVYSDTYANNVVSLLINAHGDLAFKDSGSDELYQAYNTTPSPEPGTLLLLGTGLSLGVVLQRRLLS